MAEYIKRDFALDVVKRTSGDYVAAFAEIAHVESADAVEVVRCKDCKHFVCDMDLNHEEYPNKIEADGLCQITDKYCDMPHFCSYGERREENGES